MSDSPEPETPAAPAGPKPSKIVLVLLILNLGASGFATFKLMTAKTAAAAGPAALPPEITTTEVVGPILAIDPFVVNLDEQGQSRYLKLSIQLELIKESATAAFEKNKQYIRDSILSHLSGLKLADTLGAAAKDSLRAALMKKLEEILGPHQVRRLFFQEFVVQ